MKGAKKVLFSHIFERNSMCAILDEIQDESDEVLFDEASKAVNRRKPQDEPTEDDWHTCTVSDAVTKGGDKCYIPVTRLMHTSDGYSRPR